MKKFLILTALMVPIFSIQGVNLKKYLDTLPADAQIKKVEEWINTVKNLQQAHLSKRDPGAATAQQSLADSQQKLEQLLAETKTKVQKP